MSYLSDITQKLLAGHNLGRINSGIKAYGKAGNPYGIGNPPGSAVLPPEAYPNGIAPPGYETYGPEGYAFDPPENYQTNLSSQADQGDQGNSLPPAAQNVIPGSAYPEMPSFGGEPTIIVHQPYSEPGLPEPEPYVPPDWIYPSQPPDTASYPPEADLAPSIDWTVPTMPLQQPYYAGPGYTNPQEANAFFGGLINWNGPGQVNISDPEMTGGGLLAAKFGLSGIQGGGVDWRKHIK